MIKGVKVLKMGLQSVVVWGKKIFTYVFGPFPIGGFFFFLKDLTN